MPNHPYGQYQLFHKLTGESLPIISISCTGDRFQIVNTRTSENKIKRQALYPVAPGLWEGKELQLILVTIHPFDSRTMKSKKNHSPASLYMAIAFIVAVGIAIQALLAYAVIKPIYNSIAASYGLSLIGFWQAFFGIAIFSIGCFLIRRFQRIL